ncbi:MAG: SDR family oxidoreductase [Bacteroidota bacterium]|nr:SDR family oxidoreductase [Bacteroidota bacterium]
MSKIFLFAGASSAIAKQSALLLKDKGHKVIGISTKEVNAFYDEFYKVEKYDFETFPKIDSHLDGIVYFPGTINLKPFSRLTASEFINDFQINSFGAVAFAQAYLSNLKKSPCGSIVFLSSVAARIGLPFHTSIAMAKGGVEGFAKALAAELAPSIRVNCVAPSLVNTPLGDKFINTPEKMEQMQQRNPLRQVGNPLDVANAITFLLSEESAWVSGQVFSIDGGMSTIKN